MKWWTRCHNLSFLSTEFQGRFSLSSFILIKRLFSSSSLSAIKVVSSTYLKLLIFLLAVLIPACDLCSPAFCIQVGFNNMWTKNLQMYKLDLEKAEEQEIRLPTFVGSSKKQGNSEKHLLLLHSKPFDCVDHNKLWKLKEMGVLDHLTCLLRNLYAGQEAIVKILY